MGGGARLFFTSLVYDVLFYVYSMLQRLRRFEGTVGRAGDGVETDYEHALCVHTLNCNY